MVDWPANGPISGEHEIAVGPIAVVQPASTPFVRDAEVRQGGSLAHSESSPIRIDRPTVLIGMVCRAPAADPDRIEIERVLVGETRIELPAMPIEFEAGEGCAQVRDVIPAGTLGPGRFVYQIEVVGDDDEPVFERRRSMSAAVSETVTGSTRE